MRFRNRTEAGEKLAAELDEYSGRVDVIVLALPRGGVPIGHAIARALGVPLDVFVVRKLGVPGHEELAMGAIATGGIRVINREVVEALGIPAAAIERIAEREEIELARRERQYRGSRRPLPIRGSIVILTDDGLATGSTMRAAITAVRKESPRRLVVAVPVGAPSTCRELGEEADEMICLSTPEPFDAVGFWYEDFSQTTDEEVEALLEDASLQKK
jgi:putative phosphoribosyl transferase